MKPFLIYFYSAYPNYINSKSLITFKLVRLLLYACLILDQTYGTKRPRKLLGFKTHAEAFHQSLKRVAL